MERLDKVVLERNPGLTRSRVEGLIKAGFVAVNGIVTMKAGAKVSPDAEISVYIPPPVPANPEPEDNPVPIIYEDSEMMVIDKPAGMVVHPAPGHASGTLVNALLHHCPALASLGCRERPGIVHRLDQETSGLIVVAKTEAAMMALARAFASHTSIEKTYLAVCHGRPRLDAGRLESFMARHPVDRKRRAIVERGGKLAITDYRVVAGACMRATTLLECKIATGRTHQIRLHMASLGCPVIGDKMYGKSALDKQLSPVPQRQMLHAWRLCLRHPATGEKLSFESPVPPDMQCYIGDFSP